MPNLKSIVKFDMCPVCGCKNRVIGDRVDKMVLDGELPPNAQMAFLTGQAPLVDTTKLSKLVARHTVPMIAGAFDACAECGTVYLIEAIEMTMMYDNNQQPGAK